jgi:TolB-like protein
MTTIRHYPLFLLSAVLGILAFVSSPASADFKKTKIAVLDFQTQGSHETKDMDKIVSEWLITGLVETGRFDVVERRLLEKIMEEHKLGMTGIADPESVAQLGKVLGVKVIVTGTILSFDRTVEINARLINVETGSIISAEKVHASSATRLSDLVSQIVEKLSQAFPLEGYVVMRSGNKVTLDLGKRLGCKPDMKFIAFKEGRVIKHPKTGEVLDVETIEIGEISITDVRDKTATGIITREASDGAVEYGSMVRSAVRGQLIDFEEERSAEPGRSRSQEPRASSDGKKKDLKRHIPMPGF